jgi:hypothetical protein
LAYLRMGANDLTGTLEQSLCADNRTGFHWEVDCDKVECSCCSSCE